MRISYVTDDTPLAPGLWSGDDERLVRFLRKAGHRVEVVLPWCRDRPARPERAEWRCDVATPWAVSLALQQHWRGWAPDVICWAVRGERWGEAPQRAAAVLEVVLLRIAAGPALRGPELEVLLQQALQRHREGQVIDARARFAQRIRPRGISPRSG